MVRKYVTTNNVERQPLLGIIHQIHKMKNIGEYKRLAGVGGGEGVRTGVNGGT